MMVTIKYFYEKTHGDYIEYTKIWNENNQRLIFLDINSPLHKQINSITNDLTNNKYKDILAIKNPNNNIIINNKIINDILLGKGFTYNNNKIWYPKEVWIYKTMPFEI